MSNASKRNAKRKKNNNRINPTADFCLKLVQCESEEAVEKLLRTQGYWDDERAWSNYGNNENNFSQIGNQQSRPEAALVEKLINSIDSVLMAHCLRNGIDPTSSAAPQTMQEAAAQFLSIPNGRIADLTPTLRTAIAENIRLIATGSKGKPNYIFADKGEGQTALTLPKTILSLGESNKLRIPFVQGKFNMGGSGVLQFCGRAGFQLVVTRRDPAIADPTDPTSDDWAFTIVRRFDPKKGVKSSCYKYLAPFGKILHFNQNELPLLPGKYPLAYGEPMQFGAFIKVFEYAMPGGLKTSVLLDLYNQLSLLMAEVALPIRLMERRIGYSAHSYETTLAGLRVRLADDRHKNLEDNFPASSALSVEGQKMDVRIMAFKPKKRGNYTDKDGVIFEVNGQAHGTLSTSFFSRHAVNMGYIRESILVEVDCSKLDGRAREDLFMSSRDRLRSGPLRNKIEKELETLIANHPGLKALRARRREEAIKDKLDDAQPLADMLNQAVKNSPSLAQLLGLGQRVGNPYKTKASTNQQKFNGQRYPSIFKLSKGHSVTAPKQCPINQKRFRVKFTTDAENEYFTRSQDRGSFKLTINGTLVAASGSDYSGNLWEGKYDLNICLPKGVKVGQTLHIETEVTDPTRLTPFKDVFYVEIGSPVVSTSGPNTPRKPAPSNKSGKGNNNQAQLSIPDVIEVSEDDWGTHGFDENSALKVESNGEGGFDFFLNRDNVYLLREQKYNRTVDPKIQLARFKYSLVLVGLAMLNEDKKSNTETDVETAIFNVTKAISPVLLPLIQAMGDLRNE